MSVLIVCGYFVVAAIAWPVIALWLARTGGTDPGDEAGVLLWACMGLSFALIWPFALLFASVVGVVTRGLANEPQAEGD
jgi:hypothetical protein